jgi:long-subunit acyl-CoA synthetase (AMP-forming)
VEKLLLESPYIDNCLVAGADKPFVVAIILPDFDLLKNWCDSHQVHWTCPPVYGTAPQSHTIHANADRFVLRCAPPSPTGTQNLNRP